MTIHTNMEVYNDAGAVFSDVTIEKLAWGFQFTEGPLWFNGTLLFSDIPANKIYQLFPDGIVSTYLDKSGFSGEDKSHLSDMIGSNALALDSEGMIVICQHGDHAIARLDINSKITYILTDNFNGRLYNSPNDLAIKNDGSIYFTDPPYGLKDQVLHPDVFQETAGMYRFHKGTTALLQNNLRYPNGICFSPDEQYIYTGSNHPEEPFIYRHNLSEDGNIEESSVFIEQNADGIKTDKEGRLYLATDNGILIVSPAGERIALISLPESLSNMAWGGTDSKELYITARSSIYRIKNF